MTPFAYLEKSAARGDQILKQLSALANRALSSTNPSRAQIGCPSLPGKFCNRPRVSNTLSFTYQAQRATLPQL